MSYGSAVDFPSYRPRDRITRNAPNGRAHRQYERVRCNLISCVRRTLPKPVTCAVSVYTSANTLTEDRDIRIIRISEREASDPYYPDIRIIRISELSGYSNYPGIRIRLSRNYGLYIGLYKPYI